jgi:ABC-type glycerol-3-phosphate transport system substrate-binding protein
MKKLLALVLALVMAFSVVACASQPANDSKEPKKMTIALRGGAYAEAIKSSLPAFEEANNVKIDVLELSEDDLHSSIALDATNAKGTYDFVMADASWMAEFANAGVLADLGALGYKFDEDIIPATTAACVFDGKTYLAPYYGNVTVLMYNKALVEAAG